ALTVNVSVGGAAATGLRDVTVTSPDFSPAVTASNAFTVNAGPTVATVSPASLPQGVTNSTVTVNGTGFVSGTWGASSVAFSGSGVTVSWVPRTSASTLSVVLSISGAAATTARDVTVTSPDG